MDKKRIQKLTRIKYLIIILMIFFLYLLVWILSKSFLTVEVTPSNSIVTIDNMPVALNQRGAGKKVVKPGTHTIRIEAEGFVGQSENIKIGRGKSLKYKYSLESQPEPKKVTEEANFISIGESSNDIYYLGDRGRTIFKATLNLANSEIKDPIIEPLTDPKLSGIEDIVWAPEKDLALFKKKDGYYLFDFKKYDFLNQTETFWGRDIGDAAWSPDNSKIAYYYAPASGERSLIFSNTANTEMTRVYNFNDLDIENPKLRWSPDSEWLIIIPQSKKYDTNKIYLFNAYSRTIKELTDTGSQADARFSPDSSKIVYTTYSKLDNSIPYVISLMNKDGSEKKSLDIRAKLSNVAWDKSSNKLLLMLNDSVSSKQFLNTLTVNYDQQNENSGISLILPVSGNYNSIFQLDSNDKIVIFQVSGELYAIQYK